MIRTKAVTKIPLHFCSVRIMMIKRRKHRGNLSALSLD
eukprot:COSAG01_NODE_373_length_17991_cov_284.890075_13_plen_38_part_00